MNPKKVIKMKSLKKLSVLAVAILFLQTLSAAEITSENAKQYREKFVEEAKKYIGCSYEYGAIGPSSFDCSGLVYFTASQATEIQLPRTAKAIYNFVTIIPPKDKEPGDLLFFKTTDSGSISHVGIYIGNDQFISTLSDGNNTGVVISSLQQDYWKPKYVATGRFLPASKNEEILVAQEKEPVKTVKDKTANKTNKKTSTETPKEISKKVPEKTAKKTSAKTPAFLSDLSKSVVFDGDLFVDWSLLSARSFSFQFRGVDFNLNARYTDWMNEPGIQMGFFYDAGLGVFQLPVAISLTINDYVRAYAGPVFTFGNAKLIGSDKEIRSSIFPGVLGLTLSTEKLDLGPVDLQFVQNICYTVYNNADNSALSIFESAASGLVFHTGVKVTLPLSEITK